MQKISIKFFGTSEIRAVWSDNDSKWYFSVIDIIGAIRKEGNYEKNRNYWEYLKAKLKKENFQLVSLTNQLKLLSKDGKKYKTDVLTSEEIVNLTKHFPTSLSSEFIVWFTNTNESIDEKSKQKAYSLFNSTFLNSIDVGTIKGLKQIHSYIFGGLYDFAGKIRKHNISKGGFMFANVLYLDKILANIDLMPENNFEEIIDKYVEMNIAHPFNEGNGRATRLWLDLILKKRLLKCVDWSKIEKYNYLHAMTVSTIDSTLVKKLLFDALTDNIHDKSFYLKCIDKSYSYEEIK